MDDLINEVRYRYDLVAAEDVEPWLTRHGLTLADLYQHGELEFWRQQAAAKRMATDPHHREPRPGDWEAFAADLIFTGHFTILARGLATRLLVSEFTGTLTADEDNSPAPSATELARLGREAAWWNDQLRLERRYAAVCAGLCTNEARTQWLRARGASLTHVELAWLDLDSAAAMREAQQCVTADGQTLEQVASTARLQVETRSALLDELEPELRAVAANRRAGEVVPWRDERAGHFRLLQLRVKHSPQLADPTVRAKVDAGIVAAHFEPRLVTEVQWLLEAAHPDHGS